MVKNKKGISLIVLVITIIVMIILAAAVVVTLNNSGIIGRASEAVDDTELNDVRHLATLAWSEAYLEGLDLEDAVFEALENNNVNTDKYDIIVTDKGVTVNKKDENAEKGTVPPADWQDSVRIVTEEGVPIPKGFARSPYATEDQVAEGMVIYALTEDEIKAGKKTITTDASHQYSLENRNQFVWVPVDRDAFVTEFVRKNFAGTNVNISNELGKGYWEIVLDENNMPAAQNMQNSAYISDMVYEEITAMYESVKKYGGFYIGRYEAGTDTYDEVTFLSNGSAKVAMGKYPITNIDWGNGTMADDNGGAVAKSRELYPKSNSLYGAVSTLTYGVQWDAAISSWVKLEPTFDFFDPSKGIWWDTIITASDFNTNAKQSRIDTDEWALRVWTAAEPRVADDDPQLFSTGACKNSINYNVYDMGGNLFEWTMEGTSTYQRSVRGSYWWHYVMYGGVNDRDGESMGPDPVYLGFRPSLYIK
ncbi:MAG: hypothetical protein IKK84_05180 [Clostridia bacterium]|nr:hypothetical protein [Clostridia bacterium]